MNRKTLVIVDFFTLKLRYNDKRIFAGYFIIPSQNCSLCSISVRIVLIVCVGIISIEGHNSMRVWFGVREAYRIYMMFRSHNNMILTLNLIFVCLSHTWSASGNTIELIN